MFTTVEQVKELTTYDVTPELIYQAQAIVEAFVGRTETDVTNAADFTMVGRAVAYQSAYMLKNMDTVYEQLAVRTISQSDGTTVLDVDMAAPFLAPLAVFCLRNLSWRKTKSVKTGAMWNNTVLVPWERD